MKEIPKEEIARLKAEGRMADNWNRKDAEMVGVFYKYYIEELLNQLADSEYWKKLVEAQEQYIDYLIEASKPAQQMAFIHGFKYDVHVLDEEVILRENIEQLKSQEPR